MRKTLLAFCVTLFLFTTNTSILSQTISLPDTSRTWQDMMQDPNTNFWETKAKFEQYWMNRPVTRGSGYKAYKRWEWFMAPRVSPQGAWPNPDAVYQAMQESPSMFQDNMNMPGSWSYIGNTSVPTNGGGAGRINSVRALPGSTTTFFACSPGGGLWKSTDSGASWNMLGTDFLASIGVSDVAIDPTNTNIMYIATGDCDAGDTYALGVLKSTDGGNTWNTTGLNWAVTQSRTTARILINPTNTQIIVCATSNGIYRSTDGGTTFSQMVTGSFKDLRMKPGDATTWYATSNQFYKSTDGGITWTQITSGLPTSANTQRMSVAVSAANSAVVYVLASGNDSGILGVWKSTDSGTTFTQQADNNPNYLNWDTSATANTGGQGWYDLRIEATETDANTIYIGGVNVWKSTDGGVNFTLAGHWYGGGGAPYVHADIHAIYQVPGSTRIIVGCDGGVFSTTNGGPNFTDISSSLQIGQLYRLSVAGTNSNIVISGWQDNGTNLKNGASFSRPLGGDGMDCQINPSNASIMYGEIYYGSISKSTNGGTSWSNIVGSGGTNEDEDGAWITPYVLGPNPNHIFVGKSLVFKSTDGGATFTASAAFGGTGDCNDIAVAPSDANIVYASKGSNLFKSTDNAATFTAVAGMQGSFISDIAIHSTDPNKVWVTFSNYTAGAKIYYTTNGGTSWTNISGTLPNLPANAVAFAPGSSNGIYVGMDAGVYYRDDVLGGFVPYLNSLPNVQITDLDVHTGTSTITAATYGRGLWRAPLYALPNLDAVLTGVTSPTGTYCSTSVTPEIQVLNAGTNPIISMTIQYQVSGQTIQTYNFVGNIATGVTQNITLPAVDYGAGSFTFTATITAVNTVTDDNTANNSQASSYYCVNGTNNATFVLETDCWPTETSWNITDSGGNVVFSGSGYGSETTNNIPLCLPDGCFTLNMFDSYGDGLSNTGCALGNGSYSIYDNGTLTNLVVMTNANYGTAVSHNFCYPLSTIPGCTDNTACNYNPLATVSDGTCTYGPTNDVCSGASTITVNAAPITVNNTTTCINTVNPTCGGTSQIKDLWYKFVYTGGKINISTNFTGATLNDTRIALYSSCGGTQIACNDDIGGGNFKSLITVACGALNVGQTYYVQAGGYNTNTGTFSLQVYTTVETCNNLDDDCDGVIDNGFDIDGDGYTTCNGDCNDNNAAVKPSATEICNLIDDDCDGLTDENVLSTFYQDADNDGYGNISITTQACTAPVGYAANSTDCNDANNAIRPNATETCNSIDDNCNGQIDEGVLLTFYRDIDNDGYGNIAVTTQACSAPVGYVANSTDCNDNNNAIRPNATETCNGIDDDCDSAIDEGVQLTFYRDLDNDGYGNASVTTLACSAPVGYVANSTDCNDSNNAVHPGATEICNTIDDDCDSSIDEGVQTTYYRDLDGDGFGDASVTTQACSAPVGYVSNSTDCNDNNNAVRPGATETCNSIDDDCDTQIDEGVQLTFYRDQDNDGYGNISITISACSAPIGYVSNSTDCNDSAIGVHPGATETCNSIDDDCDLSIDEGFDADNDGFTTCEGDCNDNNANIFPGAPEACNGIDDNCDAAIDNGVTTQNYYTDNDGDGYGSTLIGNFCSAPANSALNNLDCNDSNAAINPNAAEICNGINDDCDAFIDEGFDNDGDGYTSCGGDCNDNNISIHPLAAETCNNTDDDCDGLTDEGFDQDNDGYTICQGDCNDAVAAIHPNASEVCNNADDDCDGLTDEGYDIDNDGYSTCEGDCNDNNANIYPGAPEACNGIDDNCDTFIDNGVTTQNYYNDNDGDGYGSTLIGNFCSPPANSSLNNLDCNDNDAAINPNAVELCNAINDDCDGQTDEGFDNDGDGYTTCNGDCNDASSAVHPNATETCNNLDDDCDGLTDENLTLLNWYIDSDGDGYGSAAATPIQNCAQPIGFVLSHNDCNDGLSSVHPTAVELCANGIDEDCDGLIDEGCNTTGITNDNMSSAINISSTGNIYPYCNTLSGTCLGATPSPEANPVNVITGEDVWYRFTAISPACRISFASSNFDGVVELYNGSGGLLNTENLTGSGGTEYLNYTGLSEGQQYFIAVRNYDSAQGNGTFTICAQALMDSNCDFGPGSYPICNNFKADWTAANFYTFNFTNINGGITTSATTIGYVQLGNFTLALLPGETYINTIDAVYNLQNGLGQTEQIVVIGNEPCMVTIAPQSNVQVKLEQRCPAGITRSTYLRGTPNVCGATSYEFEFTKTDEAGQPLAGAFVVQSSSSYPIKLLSFNTPQALIAGAYYSVRIRPVFPAGPGIWGTPRCIHIVTPAINPGVIEEVSSIEPELIPDGFDLNIYPNPNDGAGFTLYTASDHMVNVQWQIIDAFGRTVFEHNTSVINITREQVELQTPLAQGLYFVRANADGKTYVRTMIVND